MPAKPRAESRLGFKLDKKVSAYALAAGAAGVGLIGHAPSAEASVVYTAVHENAIAASPIDIDHDGVPDFAVSLTYYCGHACRADLFVQGQGTTPGSIQIGRAPGKQAIARKVGGQVDRGKSFYRRAAMAAGFTTQGIFYQSGSWANVQGRYLGLKFRIGKEIHYGWARLNVQVESVFGFIKVHAVLTGYAYETERNKPIITGDTGQGARTLGHLALGTAHHK